MNSHRTELYQLARACPHGECVDSCPLKAIRRLPLEQRYAEIIRLTDHQAADIRQAHILCDGLRSQKR